MKKILLSAKGNYFKANLHCHSTVSDGKKTPEEIKEIYKRHGYSIVAFTDHDVMISHPELRDETFLPMDGYEIEMTEEKDGAFAGKKCCHICLVALKENLKQVCWHREKYLVKNGVNYKHLVRFDESLPDFERYYTPECINTVIKTARENGFFVTYNHPVWSMESYPEYTAYHGMHAMEIFNYASFVGGFPEYNPKIYDDMLRAGERIFCTATDDNHDAYPEGHPRSDSCGGFIMLQAKELSYPAVAEALEKGVFYSSEGPEIYELTYEDGVVNVKCSPATIIALSTDNRHTMRETGEAIGETVTEATFTLQPSDKYFRVTVTDIYGKHANTNAYFVDELQ